MSEKENEKKKELSTKEKAESIVELLITQAHNRLQSDEPLTASEMKACLDICKTYSSGITGDSNVDILSDLPFDDEEAKH